MDKEDAFVSIIIPAYNYGHLISDAISSCLMQSWGKKEIIVVNDGSNDCTDNIIKRYCRDIFYIKQNNQGVSLSRNKGASLANGNWLLFLDADDLLFENALIHLISCACNSDAGVIFGQTVQYDKNNKVIKRYNKIIEGKPPIPAKNNFLKSLIVTPGAAIVRKDVFQRVNGFKLGLHPSEDRHFWLKCGTLTEFKGCDEDIVQKRTQKKSASLNCDRIIYKGFLVQLDYLTWCYENNIDSSFISYSKQEIVELSIKKAIAERSWFALKSIILHSKFCNIYPKNFFILSKIEPFFKFFPSFINDRIILSILR